MGTEAVHRALVRFAQGQLGKDVGVPNDVGFENFDWPTVAGVRDALEALGIGYGVRERPARAASTSTPATRSPRRRNARQPHYSRLSRRDCAHLPGSPLPVRSRAMRKMTEQEWHAFVMDGTRTGKVATARKDGRPHVVPVWFVLDGEDVVFTTSATSVKGAGAPS